MDEKQIVSAEAGVREQALHQLARIKAMRPRLGNQISFNDGSQFDGQIISRPTGASAADQGVRPTWHLQGVTMGLWPTKANEDAEKPKAPVAYARGSDRSALPNRER
jgi:hypothetical protein